MAVGQLGVISSHLKKLPKHTGFCHDDAVSCLGFSLPVRLNVGLWLFLTYSGSLTEIPFCGVSLKRGRCLPTV